MLDLVLTERFNLLPFLEAVLRQAQADKTKDILRFVLCETKCPSNNRFGCYGGAGHFVPQLTIGKQKTPIFQSGLLK
jgi:hypothetical protein